MYITPPERRESAKPVPKRQEPPSLIASLAIIGLFGFFVIRFLIGAFTTSPEEAASRKEVNLITEAQYAVRSQMKDPSSAEFSGLRVKGSSVCGEVNGKNSFGAYSGFKRFVSSSSTAAIDDDSKTFASIYEAACY